MFSPLLYVSCLKCSWVRLGNDLSTVNILVCSVMHMFKFMYIRKCYVKYRGISSYCCGLLFSVIKVDEFTGQLWKIYETVRQEGIAQVWF